MFFVCYIPVILYVKPYQLRHFLYPGFALIMTIMLGLLIFATHENGGSAGSLMSSKPIVLTKSSRAFYIVQCIVSTVGTYGGASERFSDWTRFAKMRQAPTISLFLVMSVAVLFSGLIGALVTSAHYEATAVLEWNPLSLLAELQAGNYSPGV